MPAAKTDMASFADDFCSHIGTVSQAVPAAMSQLAQRIGSKELPADYLTFFDKLFEKLLRGSLRSTWFRNLAKAFRNINTSCTDSVNPPLLIRKLDHYASSRKYPLPWYFFQKKETGSAVGPFRR